MQLDIPIKPMEINLTGQIVVRTESKGVYIIYQSSINPKKFAVDGPNGFYNDNIASIPSAIKLIKFVSKL